MYNLAEILSIAYAILVTVGYIPALISLIKDNTVKGVSHHFWSLIVITVSISFTSLMVTHATSFQVVSVGLNLTLGIVCLILYSIRKKDLYPIMFSIIFMFIIMIVMNYSISSAQTIATVTIILAYISQIYNFYKTKNAEGTNRYLFLIIGIGLACLVYSMMLTHTYIHVMVTEAVNFILIMVCYLQANYYLNRG